jgi:hypothetical protein
MFKRTLWPLQWLDKDATVATDSWRGFADDNKD